MDGLRDLLLCIQLREVRKEVAGWTKGIMLEVCVHVTGYNVVIWHPLTVKTARA